MRIAATGPVSRLYKRLVIEAQTAASAGGWYSDSGLDTGRVAFYAIAAESVSPEKLDQAIQGVVAEVRRDGVSQAELDRARSSYLAEFVYTADSQRSRSLAEAFPPASRCTASRQRGTAMS